MIKKFSEMLNEKKGGPLHMVWQDGIKNTQEGLATLMKVYKQLGFTGRVKEIVDIQKTLNSMEVFTYDFFNDNPDIESKF